MDKRQTYHELTETVKEIEELKLNMSSGKSKHNAHDPLWAYGGHLRESLRASAIPPLRLRLHGQSF